MNKETIYIEPSDDITDILSRLKGSDKKVVALVPPKKPTVLLSSVNIKLIARTAKAEKKAVVLVTTDDSLTKLAMSANLPVAPSLKSRPVMPEDATKEESKAEAPSGSDLEDDKSSDEDADSDEDSEEADDDSVDNDAEKDDESAKDEPEEDESDKDEPDTDDDESSEDTDDDDTKKSQKPATKSKKKAKKEKEYSNAFVAFVAKHRLPIILGAVGLVGLALFLIWAFTIAPRVDVSVSVRTTAANFSENVTFTKDSAKENSETGSFYIHEEKLEKDAVVKFTATGKKDMGEPASGSLVAYAYFNNKGSIDIPAGTTFSLNGLQYVSTDAASLSLSGTSKAILESSCDNYQDQNFDILGDGCQVSTLVSIKASAAGEDYNVAADTSGWSASVTGVNVYNHDAISGGTSRIVTVVQQSDVNLALDKLKNEESTDSKNELYGKLSDSVMAIEASYKVSTTDPQSSPAVGEEVKDGVTPQVSTKTTYSVLTIDSVRLGEFIKKKANVEDGKHLYSIGDPFIEYFSESSDGSYTGKLKTTYKVGPEISETEILDQIRGEKIGRIEPKLKDAFPGISSVKTEKSYFWVNSVPSDENKVKINLTIEE